jgi:hypothetical protein
LFFFSLAFALCFVFTQNPVYFFVRPVPDPPTDCGLLSVRTDLDLAAVLPVTPPNGGRIDATGLGLLARAQREAD